MLFSVIVDSNSRAVEMGAIQVDSVLSNVISLYLFASKNISTFPADTFYLEFAVLDLFLYFI